jgi:hypothetical protein
MGRSSGLKLQRRNNERIPVSFPQLPGQLRLILWATLIGAVFAAVYAEFDVAIYGLPHLAWYGAPRGFLVGAVIASILSYLEVVVLPGPYGAPLRRSAFPVHVAVKTRRSCCHPFWS